MTQRPFIPRPPGEPAWWAQPGKSEEFAAIERERRAAELAHGVRNGGSMKERGNAAVVVIITLAVATVLGLLFFGLPAWNVWRAGLAGESELNQASWNRRIAIQEAQAKRAAAVELAQAEIERAKGVAQANKIIADSLKGHEEYLRYLWIVDVAGQQASKTVIYVPTEANLPILEAQRLKDATP